MRHRELNENERQHSDNNLEMRSNNAGTGGARQAAPSSVVASRVAKPPPAGVFVIGDDDSNSDSDYDDENDNKA